MYRNRTEAARRSELKQGGIGPSAQAVGARRVREVAMRKSLIEEGRMLPGWMGTSLEMPERLEAYWSSLSPDATLRAQALLAEAQLPPTPPSE